MNRYLLDTNHASGYWKGDSAFLERLGAVENAEFALCMPSVGELWYMAFNSARVGQNFASLQLLLGKFEIWEFDMTAAMEFGRIRAELRRIGRPIPQIDAQIAAIARLNDLTLLTNDRAHFKSISGLKIENWLA